jgi:hypothetical protein
VFKVRFSFIYGERIGAIDTVKIYWVLQSELQASFLVLEKFRADTGRGTIIMDWQSRFDRSGSTQRQPDAKIVSL